MEARFALFDCRWDSWSWSFLCPALSLDCAQAWTRSPSFLRHWGFLPWFPRPIIIEQGTIKATVEQWQSPNIAEHDNGANSNWITFRKTCGGRWDRAISAHKTSRTTHLGEGLGPQITLRQPKATFTKEVQRRQTWQGIETLGDLHWPSAAHSCLASYTNLPQIPEPVQWSCQMLVLG